MEKTLKNQIFNNSQQSGHKADDYQNKLTDLDRAKLKLDANATVAQPFPFKPQEFKYPKPAINIGNELYLTSNMTYGKLQPSEYEIQDKWFPNNNTFTNSVPGGPYENNSLRTEITNSKVHDYLDGFN